MPGFFSEFSSPKSEIVDPRRDVKLSWFYYFESGDKAVQYYLVSWKPANVKGWGSATTYRVNFPESSYNIPPYTMAENSFYSWKVEAWALNADGTIMAQGSTGSMMETTGYTHNNENIFSGGNWALINWFGFGGLEPGEYEVRVKVRNARVWGEWSNVATVKLYDTRKFIRKSGQWWATPLWRKQSNIMKPAK